MNKHIKTILWIILGITFLLRVIHIFYDLPIMNIADETESGIYGTINMLAQKTIFIPSGSSVNYPGLTSYLYLPFSVVLLLIMLVQHGALEAVQQAVILNNGVDFLVIARLLSAIAGTITVYFVFKIANRMLIGEKWALLAAFLASVNLIFLVETSFGRPWGICTMFLTIAVYYLLKNSGKKDILLTGLFCGLAYATHQAGAFLFPILLIISFFKNKHRAFFSIIPFVCVVAVITVLHPDNLSGQTMALFDKTISSGGLSYFGISFVERFKFYVVVIAKYFPIETVLIVAALILGKLKKFKTILLICFVYYLVIGPLLGTNIVRYLTPIMPLFAIIVAGSLKGLFEKFKMRNFLIGATLIFATWNAFFWTIDMIKPSTLELTRDWVLENLKPDEWIIVQETSLFLPPSQEAIELMKEYESDYFLRREQMIENIYQSDYDPAGKYNYANLYMFEGHEGDVLNLNGYYMAYESELADQEPVIGFYSTDNFQSQKDLTGDKLDQGMPFLYLPTLLRSGSNINIYKWPNT